MAEVSRREREKEQHRLEILEGAKRLFARKGFSATTMDEIAEEAEFSKGAIYNYFPSKERLFLSLIEEKIEQLFAEVRGIIGLDTDVGNKIARFVDVHLSFFEKDREFFQILHTEAFRFKEEMLSKLHSELQEKFTEYLTLMSRLMHEGISGSLLKDIQPRFLASALVGMLNSFIAQWIMQGGKGSLRGMRDIIVELFFEGAKLKH